ncbi:hypothetical protein ACXO5G_07195 [Lactobacillus delbrueckii subsp. bulgaricus]
MKQVKECVITTPAAMNLDGEKKEAAKYHLVVQSKSLNLVIQKSKAEKKNKKCSKTQ